MRKDILQVVTQGVQGKKKHVNLQGMTRLSVSKGFNEPTNSIEIDTFEGLGNNYEARETALINISFANGQSWTGTFKQLEDKVMAVRLNLY